MFLLLLLLFDGCWWRQLQSKWAARIEPKQTGRVQAAGGGRQQRGRSKTQLRPPMRNVLKDEANLANCDQADQSEAATSKRRRERPASGQRQPLSRSPARSVSGQPATGLVMVAAGVCRRDDEPAHKQTKQTVCAHWCSP